MSEPVFDMPNCLEQVRRGDEAAARELFHHLHPLVLKVVRSHLPRRMAEEDLVQTVFMKIFANLNQYSAKAPFEHWVSRIAVNTCIKALRAEMIRPEFRMADLSEDENADARLAGDHAGRIEPGPQSGRARTGGKTVGPAQAERPAGDHADEFGRTQSGRSPGDHGLEHHRIKVRAYRAREKLRSCSNPYHERKSHENKQ